MEFGLEMDFFKGKDLFGFDFAYYNRQIKDDIVRTAVSSGTGYSTAIFNVGKLENSGVELIKRNPRKNNEFYMGCNCYLFKEQQ